MSQYVTRTKNTDGGVEGLVCLAMGDWSPEGPPQLGLFPFPVASQEYYREVKTEDEKGPRTKWKSWQHYKRYFDPTSAKTPVRHFVDNYVPSYPNAKGRYHMISHNDPFYGWYLGIGSVNVYQPWLGLRQLYDESSDYGFVPKPDGFDSLLDRAYKAMLPGIKAQLSLINSVIELKDFRSWARLVSNAVRRPVKTLVRNPIRAIRSDVSQPIGKLLRSAGSRSSEAYLQWSFAVAPLISDIGSVYRALQETEKRINALISHEGRVRTRHFAMNIAESLGDSGSSPFKYTYVLGPQEPWYPRMVGNTNWRYVRVFPTVFHAEMQYNYNFTAYQREHARVLAFLDALGVNFNPSIIWNALPWSFVVDWVINVSQWLDRFKTRNMEPQINILKFLWSVRRTRQIVCFSERSSWSTNPPNALTAEPLPVVTETAYRRQVQMPTGTQLEVGGLSPKEYTLGAALVLARKRRSRLYNR